MNNFPGLALGCEQGCPGATPEYHEYRHTYKRVVETRIDSDGTLLVFYSNELHDYSPAEDEGIVCSVCGADWPILEDRDYEALVV